MILTFDNVITPDEHQAILGKIASATFVDGRETAGIRLADTKKNLQIARGSPVLQEIADLLLGALKRNDAFRSATYPKQLHSVLVSRYEPGMAYGSHVDEALLGSNVVWRSDLSMTLFLKDPADYDGGELAVEAGSGEMQVKLGAGSIVVYPTGQLHRVLPVTRGERLAVVAWIQSYVRDQQARDVLWDLAQAREAVYARDGKSRAFDLINKTHTNLLRRWAEV